MEVSVATGQRELLLDAPAVISRYSTDDMAKLGLRTLRDILSFVPGVVNQNGINGNMPVMVRGVSEGFNQKVLFLLDDVPYWMPSHGDIPLLGIPIEAIESVEIIRGPGAAYYGTNATGGVIKVVTRKGQGPQDNRLSGSVGSHGLVRGSGYVGEQLDSDLYWSAALELQRDDGYDGYFDSATPIPSSYPADTPTTGDINKKEEIASFLGQLQYHDTRVMLSVFQTTTSGVAGASTLLNENDLEYESFLLHLSQALTLGKVRGKVYTDYNRHYLTYYTDYFSGGNSGGFRFSDHDENYRWRSGAEGRLDITSDFGMMLGGEYEERSTSPYEVYSDGSAAPLGTILNHENIIEKSAFAELDYSPYLAWRFLLGGRYTNNDTSGEDITPRLAVVYNFASRQSLKLLYSEGFNSPSFTQQFADFPGVVVGDEEIKPERIKNTDFAYSYVGGKTLFVANIFYYRAEDFIQKERPNNVINFFNGDPFERYGCEVDFQYKGADGLALIANGAYLYQGNSDRDYASPYSPRFTGGVGVNGYLAEHHNLGGSLRYTGQRHGVASMTVVNLNYQYEMADYQFFCTLRNLFDRQLVNPNVADFDDRRIDGGDGFNFLLGFKFFL